MMSLCKFLKKILYVVRSLFKKNTKEKKKTRYFSEFYDKHLITTKIGDKHSFNDMLI